MITVNPVRPTDVSALAQLAEEMDRFYGASEIEPMDVRQRQINSAVFSDPPSAYALAAWDGETLVGFVSYSFLWPAIGLTRSLYLKEMYVAETARRKGVGKLLMRNLYDIAIKCDCSRVEWTTDRDNVEAQRFYAELGVSVKESKLFYRIEGNQLRTQALPS
jgi:ribosomal protein S18 acetylase RimI-like enzyme